MPSQPSYNFSDFKSACGRDDCVHIAKQAENDAREHFKLKTQQAVKDFISNDGLEDLKFTHTDIWRNNPDHPKPIIMEDEYSFRTGTKFGYLAFFQNKQKTKWIVKSFKPDWNTPVTPPFVIKGSGFPRLILSEKSEG